jgi:F-type H+-transporting ATPase subunit delta
MKTGKQTRREAKGVFRSTFVNGIMDERLVRTAVQRVLEMRPRGYIPMLGHLRYLVKLEQDRRAARVESAVPLPAEQQSGLSANLQKLYGQGLNISFAHDPALIGGLRVRVGSDVYEGNIFARLQRIEENFSKTKN